MVVATFENNLTAGKGGSWSILLKYSIAETGMVSDNHDQVKSNLYMW
jgi:hypothetical protein